MGLEHGFEFVSGIAAIGEDMAQPREPEADGFENIDCAVVEIGGKYLGNIRQASLDSEAHCVYVADGRYQSRPCASPIVSTTTVNHNSLISLNTFSFGL